MLLSNLLPGLRELRASLAAGYTLLLAAFIAAGGEFASEKNATGAVRTLYDASDVVGKAGVLAALTFAAYMLGSVVEDIAGPISLRALGVPLGDRGARSLVELASRAVDDALHQPISTSSDATVPTEPVEPGELDNRSPVRRVELAVDSVGAERVGGRRNEPLALALLIIASRELRPDHVTFTVGETPSGDDPGEIWAGTEPAPEEDESARLPPSTYRLEVGPGEIWAGTELAPEEDESGPIHVALLWASKSLGVPEFALRGHERWRVLLALAAFRELDLVLVRLLGREPELHSAADRLRSEADLRVAIALPLVALGIAIAVRAPDWGVGVAAILTTLVAALAVAVQAEGRRRKANDLLTDALLLERVRAPTLERFLRLNGVELSPLASTSSRGAGE